jgi:hypothetical protein
VLLGGDREAISRLIAAGAKQPELSDTSNLRSRMNKLASSVAKFVPMICVPDVAATLDWWTSIGFNELARYSDGSLVTFGVVSFGAAEILININGKRGDHDASL